MGSFGTTVIISFIVSILLTISLIGLLRGSVEWVLGSSALWVIGLIAWIIKHRMAQREREELAEELKRGSATGN